MQDATGCAVRVLLYARTSTKDGRQDAENQVLALRQESQRRRWQIVDVVTDQTSAFVSSVKRPVPLGMKQCLHMAANRKFDILAVHSMSRLSRRGPAHTFALIHQFNQLGVRVVSITEQLFDGPPAFQELLSAIYAYMAGEESRIMSERITAGLNRKRVEKPGWKAGAPRKIFDRQRFYELRDKGFSLKQLAATFGVSKSACSRAVRDRAIYENQGNRDEVATAT